jgi:hypothetical protein
MLLKEWISRKGKSDTCSTYEGAMCKCSFNKMALKGKSICGIYCRFHENKGHDLIK